MFGHVGRRIQNLVGRQLALIDNLERRETDSDRLRELYRLDHMSSRLRRNASALVVLSGSTGADEHTAPLSLSDIVRLALGEIEDYRGWLIVVTSRLCLDQIMSARARRERAQRELQDVRFALHERKAEWIERRVLG